MDEVKEVEKLISQIADIKNRLKGIGVIRSDGKITSEYAEWFCSRKFSLKLCEKGKIRYDDMSELGERVQIESKIGSDIDFGINFEAVRIELIDYLLAVFINEDTWMVDSVYKVTNDIVKKFLSLDKAKKFLWRRESRSLSLQIYPNDESLII